MGLKLFNNTLRNETDGSVCPLVLDWRQLVQRLVFNKCQLFEEEISLLRQIS